MVLLAVRMVADVIETQNVIPSSEFKTCMTIKAIKVIANQYDVHHELNLNENGCI